MVLIYIGYDGEDFLAEAVKQFFYDTFKGFIQDYNGKSSKVAFEFTSNIKELTDDSDRVTKRIALMLCSPYSIRQMAIHAQCGILDSYNTKKKIKDKEEQQIHIIPICHSGLVSAELPEFFSSNQGLVIRSENSDFYKLQGLNNFGRSLIQSIFRIATLELDNGEANEIANYKNIEEQALQKNNFCCHWKMAWEEKENQGVKSIETTSNNGLWEKEIYKLVNELKGDEELIEVDDKRDRIGILPFLLDGNDIYVGLKRSPKNKDIYHSNTEEFGEISDRLQKCEDGSFCISSKDSCWEYLQDRLASMGHKLRQLKINDVPNDVPEKVIALLNDSDEKPRLDISIPRFIKKEAIEDNPCKYKNILAGEWIWAKDGVVEYWFYPEEKLIPAYISQSERRNHSVFIGSADILERYGWNAHTTPYTSDEELGMRMGDLFSVSARMLLTAF